LIIGVAGKIGSGKDTVAKYIAKKYKFRFASIGDIVREELRRRGLPITRNQSAKISKYMREKYGEDYWVRRLANKISRYKWKNVVISGVRSPSDVKFLKDAFKDFILVKVCAKPKIRYERLKKRKRPGYPKTYEEFKLQDKRECKEFNMDSTFKMADYTIQNNSTLESLYDQVDSLMKTIKHKK